MAALTPSVHPTPPKERPGTPSFTSVLVIDPDSHALRALRINLAAHDYRVLTATDATEALQTATDAKPDAVILELGLPDFDGIEVITRLRDWTTTPILVLTTRTDHRHKIRALDAGADDYLTKPFRLDELLARLRAIRRRATAPAEAGTSVVDTASFSVDLLAKKVHRDGLLVHLTRTEWMILELLVRNPGRLVTQDELLSQVWGPESRGKSHYLRVYFNHLRRKLEPDPAHPRHLITEAGHGYRLEF